MLLSVYKLILCHIIFKTSSAVVALMGQDDNTSHLDLRQAVAQEIIRIDQHGTADEQHKMMQQLEAEHLNKYGTMTGYAQQYTAIPRTYAGLVEAAALARSHARPVIIISKHKPGWERANVYKPNLTIVVQLFPFFGNNFIF